MTTSDSPAVATPTRGATATPNRRKRRRRVLVGVLATLLVLFVGLLAAIPPLVMPDMLEARHDLEMYDPAEAGVEAERITLTTSDGLDLAAWRTGPADPVGTVIILSGIQGPSVTEFFGYARLFEDAGWDSLLIEMRGRGQSEGDQIGVGLTEWRDVEAGVEMLAADTHVADLPIVVLGTSLGGAVAISSGGNLAKIDGVISLSALASFGDMFEHGMADSGMPGWLAALDRPFVDLYLGLSYGFDSGRYVPVDAITRLGDRPVLLAHSTGDTQVPFSQYEKLRDAANEAGIDLTTFERAGDLHFIIDETLIHTPEEDEEFTALLTGFLEENFG